MTKGQAGKLKIIVATHSGGDGAGEKKKKKPPKEKSPQQKKRNRCLRLRLLTGGCAALLSRFFSLFLRRLRRLLFLPSPRFSLLLWAATPPSTLPLLFLFSSLLRRLRRLTLPALSWAAGAAPSLHSLFPLYQTINNPLTPSHVMNLSVLHLTSLPLVTLKGRYRKPLAFFIFCHNCLNV